MQRDFHTAFAEDTNGWDALGTLRGVRFRLGAHSFEQSLRSTGKSRGGNGVDSGTDECAHAFDEDWDRSMEVGLLWNTHGFQQSLACLVEPVPTGLRNAP